jgi:hypothetical protein
MVTTADLATGDLFEIPPDSFITNLLCGVSQSQGLHWGMLVQPGDPYWISTECVGKGVSLTQFNYKRSYIYRIKGLTDLDPNELLNIIAEYGLTTYGYSDDFTIALSTIVRYGFPMYPWEGPPLPSFFPGWPGTPVTDLGLTKPDPVPINCIHYVDLLAAQLGYFLVPPGGILIPSQLEKSPYLDYLGELDQT